MLDSKMFVVCVVFFRVLEKKDLNNGGKSGEF